MLCILGYIFASCHMAHANGSVHRCIISMVEGEYPGRRNLLDLQV